MVVKELIQELKELGADPKIVDGTLSVNMPKLLKNKSVFMQFKQYRDTIENELKKQEQDVAAEPEEGGKPFNMSLFFFGSNESEFKENKYNLYIQASLFADQNGFEAVWTPERHFDQFGGLYSSPSIMASGLSTITKNIALRAGSVVLALNNPIRVAEEWSIIDNFSNGRVGIAFASGWQPNDFVLAPDNYADRHKVMYQGIEDIRSLWRGENLVRTNGVGDEVEVGLLPRPVQTELPVWVTAASSPLTFESAGKMGANILTHLTGQTVDMLKEKIQIYRKARKEAGYQTAGQVSLMLHTFISNDLNHALSISKGPFKKYLSQGIGLLSNLAESAGIDINNMPESDMETLLEHGFNRYYNTSALIGTAETALPLVTELRDSGVDEIACLIDFGIDSGTILENLVHLNKLRELATT